jgi:hypothetical protein
LECGDVSPLSSTLLVASKKAQSCLRTPKASRPPMP